MTGERRPLLALGRPEIGRRFSQPRRDMPTLSSPGAARQGQRLTPQFDALVDAFDNARAQLSDGPVDEVDPALVVVFDLAGSVKDFHNAIKTVEGLEFLSEFLDEESEPDEDFYMTSRSEGRTDDRVQHSLYMVMSNAQAVDQLIRLFNQWQNNPAMTFDRGQARFRHAFEQLRSIRYWGPTDRIRDTGLIEKWNEHLELVGQSFSPVLVEIELWYRQESGDRAAAEAHVVALTSAAGGVVKDRTQISSISYHALLVELPVQQVQAVLNDGAGAIDLLNTDEIMFVSPFTPMTAAPVSEAVSTPSLPVGVPKESLPRIALLDGLPVVNHEALAGRLTVDDPDALSDNYPVASRIHGTAMASLIIHGDLSSPGEPISRPLYVRPVMRPHAGLAGYEQVIDDKLFVDLLHRAIVRIVRGEGRRAAAAPSVRIINLSIGAQSRALVRRMSPLGRLLDWLALEYNLLFIVSAGNHLDPVLTIPASSAENLTQARIEALKAARKSSRLRGILPPGDSLNALTVGATHSDLAGEVTSSDAVWDIAENGMPALYGAVGPGVGRSIKPDLCHSGGRALYVRPVVQQGDQEAKLYLATTDGIGPGHRVASPGRGGAIDATRFTHGTSNATALVTREADRLFDILESGTQDAADPAFPNAQFHPVLVKALLVHSSSWGNIEQRLRHALNLDPARARRELTALLGYGVLDPGRLGSAATNRAVLIAGGSIGREERHTYQIPLPDSLRTKAEWHRVTVTLAYFAPTAGHLNRYRGAKVFFEKPDDRLTGGKRIDADHNAVRRGSCQHEIIDGTKAMIFTEGEALPIHVECMDDAQRLKGGKKIRYGLVVSVEAAVTTSTTIHDEVRAKLRVQARPRVQP